MDGGGGGDQIRVPVFLCGELGTAAPRTIYYLFFSFIFFFFLNPKHAAMTSSHSTSWGGGAEGAEL